MSQFNTNKWFKNQYLKEAGLNESKADSVAKAMDDAIETIDPSLSVRDFALAVGKILKGEAGTEGYGSFNFAEFMKVLHAELGMEESLNEAEGDFSELKAKLEADPDNKYLTFTDKGHQLKVDGRNGALDDLIRKYENQDLGPYKLFFVDDEDRGWIVSINKK